MANDNTTTGYGAQSPAQIAGTPESGKPQNISLNYSYAELTPRHKAMADQITALLIAYPDIVKLDDPKVQQGYIDRIMNSKSGEELKVAVEGVNQALGTVWQGIKKIDITGAAAAAESTAAAAKSATGVFGAFFKGPGIAALPFAATTAGAAEFYNQAKVLVNDMTPEKAQMIGTLYASAMQSRTVEREGKTLYGAFTGLSNALAACKAFFQTIPHWISAIWPAGGEWLANLFGASTSRSFAENMNRELVAADVAETGKAMTALGSYKGVDLPAYANATTGRGAMLQGRNGQDVAVVPPSADKPAPDVAGATRDANGKIVPPKADAQNVVADAVSKAGGAAKDKVNEATAGIDTPLEKAAAATGALLVAQAGYGMAEGATSAVVRRRENKADSLTQKADDLEARATKAREGKGFRVWERGEDAAQKLEKQAAELRAEAKPHALAAERINSRVSNLAKGDGIKGMAGKFVESAGEEVSGKLHALRNGGRLVGDKVGKLFNGALGTVGWATGKIATQADKVAEGVQGLKGLSPFAKRFGTLGAVIGPGLDVADIIDGTQKGDVAQVANAKGSLVSSAGDALIGVGVAAGATLVAGGAVLSAPVLLGGAAVGALAGGVVSLFTGGAFSKVENAPVQKPAATLPKASVPDLGLNAAAIDATVRANAVAEAAANNKTSLDLARASINRGSAQFACVSSNKLGALCTENLPVGAVTQAEAGISTPMA